MGKVGSRRVQYGVSMNNIWPERKCTLCGKWFIVKDISEWAYKRGERMLFCSWHCVRAFEQKQNGRVGRRINREQKIELVKMIREGFGISEIARQIGCTHSAVKYWQDRITEADR